MTSPVVNSPLTGNANVSLVKEINTNRIIEGYKNKFQLDVSRFFTGLNKIQVYRCLDSGYEFYYPSNLDGDSTFYEHLQNFPWYYMDWKWEHEITASLVKDNEKILEVGCAKGAFITRIAQMYKVTCVGLELNKSALEHARKNNIDIRGEYVQDHAKTHRDHYDIVCSYQVLEHIADVKSFLAASVDALKPGGRLIVSVPNNDSFIKHVEMLELNMPPHHMGLWTQKSLESLQKYYPLKLTEVFLEPLQPQHYAYYTSVMLKKKFGNNLFAKGLLALSYPFLFTLKFFSTKITGHTILCVYTKE